MTTSPHEAIAGVLAERNTGYLFGLPGGGNNLDVIGACAERGIDFVLAHTETAAAVMASAHAELSGTIGACVVTRGPGAASAVNGAAQAQQDRQPLLLMCDVVEEAGRERIAHQRIDQQALFAPVTKWATTLGHSGADSVMRKAVDVATAAPRGAVELDVDPTSHRRDEPPALVVGDGKITAEVRERLARSHRPLVIVGVGAREHAGAVRCLVAGTAIPVMMTYKAKGTVADSGPNAAGTFTGARTDGALVEQADLILAIGLDSIELIPNPWTYDAPVIALADVTDPCPYMDVAVGVSGPLAELIGDLPKLNDGWPADAARRHKSSITEGLLNGPRPDSGLTPWDVVRVVRAGTPEGTIATVDAGAHMLVAMPLWSTERPGEVLISSGLATMGYSLPAAVGAALARPDKRIVCFVGDGGLHMCAGELETIVRLRLNVTVVVFNDSTLSLIKVKQRPIGHGGSRAVEYCPTDFAAFASSMGVHSSRVQDEHQLATALAHADGTPALLDVSVQSDTYNHVIDVVRNRAAG